MTTTKSRRTPVAIRSKADRAIRSSEPVIPPPNDQVRGLQRQIFDLHALFEVSRQFHQVWDVDALMEGILLIAIEHVRVGAAAIAIVNPDDSGGQARQRSKGWDVSSEPDWTVTRDEQWASRLTEYRHPLPVQALGPQAQESAARLDGLRRAGCAVVAPIVRRNRLCGVIYLCDKVDGTPFTAGDLAFLDLLVDQFAVSLENATLSEKERRTNEELLLARQRLSSSEKLAALGQMAATIAHEVRNPAGIIHNYLNLIRPALGDHNQELGYLDIIAEELARIDQTVKSLLGTFHAERGRPEPVSLKAQVEDVIEFLRPRLSLQRITLTQLIPPSTPLVHAEPEALRQVLLNIILNAIDAMPQGGSVTFACRTDLERVHLSVTDTGPGIAPELRERLFDPFVTTKPEGQGSGLGLSICKSMLERFDAQIGVRSEPAPHRGATFTIHLWRADVRRTAG